MGSKIQSAIAGFWYFPVKIFNLGFGHCCANTTLVQPTSQLDWPGPDYLISTYGILFSYWTKTFFFENFGKIIISISFSKLLSYFNANLCDFFLRWPISHLRRSWFAPHRNWANSFLFVCCLFFLWFYFVCCLFFLKISMSGTQTWKMQWLCGSLKLHREVQRLRMLVQSPWAGAQHVFLETFQCLPRTFWGEAKHDTTHFDLRSNCWSVCTIPQMSHLRNCTGTICSGNVRLRNCVNRRFPKLRMWSFCAMEQTVPLRSGTM